LNLHPTQRKKIESLPSDGAVEEAETGKGSRGVKKSPSGSRASKGDGGRQSREKRRETKSQEHRGESMASSSLYQNKMVRERRRKDS